MVSDAQPSCIYCEKYLFNKDEVDCGYHLICYSDNFVKILDSWEFKKGCDDCLDNLDGEIGEGGLH